MELLEIKHQKKEYNINYWFGLDSSHLHPILNYTVP